MCRGGQPTGRGQEGAAEGAMAGVSTSDCRHALRSAMQLQRRCDMQRCAEVHLCPLHRATNLFSIDRDLQHDERCNFHSGIARNL